MQDDSNRQAYLEEAQDLLTELESALLELESAPADSDLIDRVFRAMHTIKGSGAMFGFDDVAHFTHDVETVFDHVRKGVIPVTKELLDLTLASRDRIQDILFGEGGGTDTDPACSTGILERLRAFLPAREEDEAPSAAATAHAQDGDAPNRAFRIRFKPPQDIFLTGSNPAALLDELRELGTARVQAHLDTVPVLSEIDAESCYVWWDILLVTAAGEQAVRDVFIFVEDDSELAITPIALEGDGEGYKKLGEILLERGDIDPTTLEKALGDQRKLGEILAEHGLVSKDRLASALAEQREVRGLRAARTKGGAEMQAASIRVAAEKLDHLVDLVGELVTVQARLSQVASGREDPVLTALTEELERLSDELRDSTLGIRMLPIGTTFSKFSRLVRDLSGELGKDIELRTEGAETELDKTVIERLGDPLVHLLRNSIDHGIETPDTRAAAGKPSTGTIRLVAEHSGGEVVIRVEDDGRGMDPAKIKAKAVQKGIVSPDADLTDKECYALIFEPGFSTAETVTAVSGRGVGMDVVKRAMEELRASIDIESAVGRGTVITIKLPLTLAIIDGLQVRVEQEFYIIPLSVVEECVELARSQVRESNGRQIVNLRGETVPYVRLREWFQCGGDAPSIEQIVVTHTGENRTGIVVDEVIGEHQTVIKSLGRVYRDVEGISGATIKGDGSLALILDIPRLLRDVMAHR
ncbi:CheA signal transduction histidine kinase [Desulfovibrio sp. X2]|uniref:chemotaxis protein CheA n=1 Tax=Desulfovibrio sp. X2 TaxID=941449 RepID=UPI000358B748|nr:chemotaxis protein CheA [Desulfovibrio sp. X2]EPR44114.1 CheA signal transduction histidine kinase [Desulfovibrio sp. X2]